MASGAWTEEEVAKLQDLYKNPDLTVAQVAKELDRTPGSVSGKALALKLEKAKPTSVKVDKAETKTQKVPVSKSTSSREIDSVNVGTLAGQTNKVRRDVRSAPTGKQTIGAKVKNWFRGI